MGRKPIVIFAVAGMTLGAYAPVVMGIDNGLGGWSILGGLIGGFCGIWLGVAVIKRYR